MKSLHFTNRNIMIMLVLAFVAILASVAVSIAAFTDRADRTVTVQTASFDDDGYSIQRTAPEGYYSAGESIEMMLTETNNKSEDITSEITMSASWESPVTDADPWQDATITLDNEALPFTVNEDNTISFALSNSMKAGSETERNLVFRFSSDLAATGDLMFSFEQISLHNQGWNTEYDNNDLSELDYGFGIAWNISRSQTTSLGNPNRDVIALLTEGNKTSEYGLQVMKNPYSSDDNTNHGAMMDWASEGSTPWTNYTITDLAIGENVTTIGDNAFAGIPGITSVTLPSTMTNIGANAFDGSGLEGELIIPASVTTIESLAFGNLPNVNAITFKHGSDDILTLPNNESEGKGTSGAFYVPDFLKTTFDFNGNSAAKNYNWAADNRMKVGISDIDLSYGEIQKGETADPFLIINPADHDAYESIQYEIVSGSDVIEIDENTGKVTGIGVGSATIQVTIVDANGDTIQTTTEITVKAIPITTASLSYEDVAVGDTVNPNLSYEPSNATVMDKKFEITTGSEYASVNTSTGVVTGTADGVAVVKVTLTDESGKETTASSVVTVGTPADGSRYVWEKRNAITTTTYPGIRLITAKTELPFTVNYLVDEPDQTIYTSKDYTISDNGTFTLVDPIVITSDSWDGRRYYIHDPFDGPYYFIIDSPSVAYSAYASDVAIYTYDSKGSAVCFYAPGDTLYVEDSSGDEISFNGYMVTKKTTTNKGDLVGYASSADETAYPSDAAKGSYWYTYLGADNIDADSVTYSANSITAGDTITVTAAPSTKNVYGGTISYLYEYSTDGGSTWNAAKTTTDTSCTITVPESVSSFVARVRANDNWGFTSSVYVYGSNVTVTPPLVGIDSVTLSYSNVNKGSTIKPTLTINPSDYDAYQSIKYEVTSGSNYVTVDVDTGAVTGVAKGTATIKVTIVDAIGTTKTATANVTVLTGIDSVALSYGTISVNGTSKPTLTINPSDYSDPGSITYSVHSGGSYASVDSGTGVVTGKAAGHATIKVTIVDATGQTVEGYCLVTIGSPTADTRYVWSKYSTAQSNTYGAVYSGTTTSFYDSEGSAVYNSTGPTATYAHGFTFSGTGFNPSSSGTAQQVTSTTYFFAWNDSSAYYVATPGSTYKYYYVMGYGTIGKFIFMGTNNIMDMWSGGGTEVPMSKYTVGVASSTTVQGATNYGYVTSTSNSAYSSNGASGSYWYVYQGSDSIDPTAVSCSTTSPTAGGTVTASVTARANTYGGTISYLYEYSTDGGLTWTSAGTTTATSKAISVPSDATSFMVRVRASDNYGFTSASYVYGTNLVVTTN